MSFALLGFVLLHFRFNKFGCFRLYRCRSHLLVGRVANLRDLIQLSFVDALVKIECALVLQILINIIFLHFFIFIISIRIFTC